jgi:non-heme chloroperoxidase
LGGKRGKRGILMSTLGAAAVISIPAWVRKMDHARDDGYEKGCGSLPAGMEKGGVVSHDGTHIWVDYVGEAGPTVFFVHGWTCNGTMFHYQKHYFKDRYRVVSMDQRGHGRSAMPESKDLSIDRMAEDIKAMVDSFEPDEFVIAGHSMGGLTAFKFHERFGEEYSGRLKGLAILDSTGTKLSQGMKLPGLFDFLYPLLIKNVLRAGGIENRLTEKVKDLLGDSSAGYLLIRYLVFTKNTPAAEVEFQREMTFSTSLPTICLAAKGCLEYCCENHMQHVDVPVLMLAGTEDKLVGVGTSKRTCEMLPDARMKVFEGAGHDTQLDSTEEVNQALDDFLRECFAG